MAKATIGGKTYLIPELNFLALEKCWLYIMEAMASQDPIIGVRAALNVIAAGVVEAPDFDPKNFGLTEGPYTDYDIDVGVFNYLKRQCKAGEIGGVRDTVQEIIKEAGLEPEEGEAQEAVSPGTETSPASSPSSSQQESKEEAGTV